MEFREWMDKIWEYCQEHWIGLAAAGLVVLILLLSLWLVHLARRDQQDGVSEEKMQSESEPEIQTEEETVPEEEPMTKEEPATKEEPESEMEAAMEPESSSEVEETLCEESFTRDETDEVLDILKSIREKVSEEYSTENTEVSDMPGEAAEEKEEPAEAAARALVSQIIRGAEKAGETAGREVASINLEIEKARLVIHYADENEKTARTPEVLLSGEKKMNPGEKRQLVKPEAEKTSDTCEQQSIPKKFGSDNMNRARSGHVYTEEELQTLIKE